MASALAGHERRSYEAACDVNATIAELIHAEPSLCAMERDDEAADEATLGAKEELMLAMCGRSHRAAPKGG